MASLHGLPPLPKSLSGLLQFSSAQWKEMERIHTMRTMIQQDIGQSSPSSNSSVANGTNNESSLLSPRSMNPGGSHTLPHRLSKTNRLDAQLALLRKEMVGLRQLDMSLLCQLWSLNESIREYKQIVGDNLSDSQPAPLSPSWEHDQTQSSSEEDEHQQNLRRQELPGMAAQENSQNFAFRPPSQFRYQMRRISSSSSTSSIEFGNI